MFLFTDDYRWSNLITDWRRFGGRLENVYSVPKTMTTWTKDGVTEGGAREGGKMGGTGGRVGERANRSDGSEGRKGEGRHE